MPALVLTAAEQAGIAAGDALLDQGMTSGANNPDTSLNTAAVGGYALSAFAPAPLNDARPLVRSPWRLAWIALTRALSSFVEAWNEIGVGGSPVFLNSWQNYTSGFNTAAYYKDLFGIVHLKGLIKLGTLGLAAFTLPVGYRPAATALFTSVSNNGTYQFTDLRVDTSGNVIPFAGGNTWFSLDGLSFRV